MPRKRKYVAPYRSWKRSADGRLASVVVETRWPDLVPELLQCISDHLPLHDFIAFRHVCHNWRSAPSGRAEITNFSKTLPWFMIYDVHGSNDRSSKYYLHDQLHPKCCTIAVPELEGATCIESMFGWLLAYRGTDVFFFDPLSFKKISLPKHPKEELHDLKGTFSSLPTCHGCIAFVVEFLGPSKLEISTCRIAGEKWETESVDVTPYVFSLAHISIVNYTSFSHSPPLNKNEIYISDSVKYVIFNYERREATVATHRNIPKRKRENKPLSLPIPWLAAFGGANVEISVSHFRGNYGDFNYRSYVSKVSTSRDEEKRSEPKKLKGAYFEPRFTHRQAARNV